MRTELTEMIGSLDLTKEVILTGKEEDTRPFLSIADLFVISSFNEGAPITLLEAFAMHKPVVSTPVGRVPDLVEDGKNGFLVPIDNSEAMAKKILYLLENPAFAQACGQKAGEMASAFDNKVEIRKLEEYYEEIIQNHSKG